MPLSVYEMIQTSPPAKIAWTEEVLPFLEENPQALNILHKDWKERFFKDVLFSSNMSIELQKSFMDTIAGRELKSLLREKVNESRNYDVLRLVLQGVLPINQLKHLKTSLLESVFKRFARYLTQSNASLEDELRGTFRIFEEEDEFYYIDEAKKTGYWQLFTADESYKYARDIFRPNLHLYGKRNYMQNDRFYEETDEELLERLVDDWMEGLTALDASTSSSVIASLLEIMDGIFKLAVGETFVDDMRALIRKYYWLMTANDTENPFERETVQQLKTFFQENGYCQQSFPTLRIEEWAALGCDWTHKIQWGIGIELETELLSVERYTTTIEDFREHVNERDKAEVAKMPLEEITDRIGYRTRWAGASNDFIHKYLGPGTPEMEALKARKNFTGVVELDYSPMGKYFEIITEQWRNATASSVIAAMRAHKRAILQIVNQKRYEDGKTQLEYPDNGTEVIRGTERGRTDKEYNIVHTGSIHLNFSFPVFTDSELKTQEVSRVLEMHNARHIDIMNMVQLLGVLLVGVFSSGSVLAVGDDGFYPESSLRHFGQNYSKLWTSSTSGDITERTRNISDPWWNDDERFSKPWMQFRNGAEFRRDEEKGDWFGFEWRTMDYLPDDYLQNVIECIILAADHALEHPITADIESLISKKGLLTEMARDIYMEGWNTPLDPESVALFLSVINLENLEVPGFGVIDPVSIEQKVNYNAKKLRALADFEAQSTDNNRLIVASDLRWNVEYLTTVADFKEMNERDAIYALTSKFGYDLENSVLDSYLNELVEKKTRRPTFDDLRKWHETNESNSLQKIQTRLRSNEFQAFFRDDSEDPARQQLIEDIRNLAISNAAEPRNGDQLFVDKAHLKITNWSNLKSQAADFSLTDEFLLEHFRLPTFEELLRGYDEGGLNFERIKARLPTPPAITPYKLLDTIMQELFTRYGEPKGRAKPAGRISQKMLKRENGRYFTRFKLKNWNKRSWEYALSSNGIFAGAKKLLSNISQSPPIRGPTDEDAMEDEGWQKVDLRLFQRQLHDLGIGEEDMDDFLQFLVTQKRVQYDEQTGDYFWWA